MDALPAIQAALALDAEWNGLGLTYEIAGDLVLPDGALIRNANFVQLSPGTTRRSVVKQGGWIRGLDNVSVDRGSDMAAGGISTSAGVYLADCDVRDVLDDIEITGQGKGVGFFLQGIFAPPPIRRLSVHDMRYSSASAPASEQVFGAWFNQCSHIELIEPQVHRIDGLIAGAVKVVQTDGMTFSGCNRVALIRPKASFCAEGIDFTGSLGNRHVLVIGGEVADCTFFGLKLANTVRHAEVQYMTALRCGWSGFAVSGASEVNTARIEDIEFVLCEAIDTGKNALDPSKEIAGFSVINGSQDKTYPQGVRFYQCTARDTQAVRTMKYGFRNENNCTANLIRNCTSIWFTVGSVSGTWG